MKRKITITCLALLGLIFNSFAESKWYDSAQIRIDSIRKGNFTFKVVDQNGNAVKDSVKVKHVKHEFSFGLAYDFNTNGNMGSSYTTTNAISCPSDTVVYTSERYAKSLYYTLPVKIGKKYKLVLKFAEIYQTASDIRVFDVYINDELKLPNFDIYNIAQAAYKALDTSFIIVAKDSVIRIGFKALKDNAKINGIALYDSIGNPLILANCGGDTTTTSEGFFTSDAEYVDKYVISETPTVDDWGKSVMSKYFTMVVTGNPFKWSGIEANKGVLKYDLVDAAKDWGTKSGLDYRGHTLMWGATSSTDNHELPAWVHTLLATDKNQAWEACKNRVMRDAGKYKDFFKEYDVLNEPLNANTLQKGIGDSINWYLFKWAKEAAPNVKLYINEYNIEWDTNLAKKYKALIEDIIKNGARIDGIGVQGHMCLRPNPKYGNFVQNGDGQYNIDITKLKTNMDILASLGLPIKFTEFDLDTMSDEKQAFNYARMMRFAFSYPACNGLVMWSLTDPGWQPHIEGMFTSTKKPKLVMDSIYSLQHNVWTTKQSGIAQDNGTYSFRGYYGKYEISVKTANGWKVFDIPYLKENQDSVFLLKEDAGKVTKPIFKSAKIVNRNQVEIKFDKEMADPGKNEHNFMFFNDFSTVIESASLKENDPTVVVLNTISPVKSGNFVTVGYSFGSQASADGGILENFGPEITENPYPALVSAFTSTDGNSITLKFNQPMTDPSSQIAQFAVAVGKVAFTINSIAKSSANDSVYIVTFDNDTIQYGEKPTISYTLGTIASLGNFELDAISNYNISNRVPKPTSLVSIEKPALCIYPNPASNVIYLSNNAPIENISIFEISGRQIMSISANTKDYTLNVESLKSGIYFINVKSDNNSITNKIVIE